ncbi:MAG: hypothetical protein NZR01_04710 [Bryobacteraceae bacterium]|nr:hypothetical protein [Bryobacteraceae bacterium]
MSRFLRALLILLLLAALFLSTWYALKWITLAEIYSYLVDTLANVLGINLYLIKVAVLLLLIPLYFGLRWSFSLREEKRKRRIGWAILTVLVVSYNLCLYFATRRISFTAKGEPVRYYAITPEGVKYSDRPGVERTYGVPFQPMTPEMAYKLWLLEKGRVLPVPPDDRPWFNPATGEALLWYYRFPDGTLEFYDRPGRHPFTNEPLREVTKEIFLEWRQKKEGAGGQDGSGRAAMAPPPPARPPEALRDGTPPAPPEDPARRKRLAEFGALVHRAASFPSGRIPVGMLIEATPGEDGSSPELAFLGSLQSDKAVFLSNILRLDLPKARGFFEDLYQGDAELLRAAASLSGVDYLVVARLSYSHQVNAAAGARVISSEARLSCRLANREGAVIVSDHLTAVGPGFSEREALENTLRLLSRKFMERIATQIH